MRAWAIREHPEPDEDELEKPPPATWGPRLPTHFLVFDTETTTDPGQRLLFGCWRYLRATPANGLRLETVEEGVFYPDDLEYWNPDGYSVLRDLQRRQLLADVDSADLDAAGTLQLLPLSVFLERKLWRAAYELRVGLVCFNFPFDLSRLAWKVGDARGRGRGRPDPFEGGFSFALWGREDKSERREGLYRPRVAIKALDSKRALKAFRSPALVDEQDLVINDDDPEARRSVFRGEFLDLRTLVFALTDKSHSLESACKAFGVTFEKRPATHGQITPDYVQYCREDVEATTRLCEATTREFLKHPISLSATRAFSPATIGKGYLKAMGIRPILRRQRFDPRLMGWAMSSYYGGRAECRIRRTPVPVAYCDFLSMYPTVCSLMELWRFLITDRISVNYDASHDVQDLLDRFDVDTCFDPAEWPGLMGIAEIIPDEDVVPVRARYGHTLAWQIGLNTLNTDEPMWFTTADLAASKLLTGKAPRVRRAIRLTPSDQIAHGLRAVDLLGTTSIDPTSRDFFRAVVEERRVIEAQTDLPEEEREWRAKGLKVLANSTSYGIYAQMIRHDLPGSRKDKVAVFGRTDEPYEHLVESPEDPGEFTFPPLAAAITGGARLLLALLERLVTDASGTYAFCDTDSMAIVATQTGGLVPCPGGSSRTPAGDEAIRALSWDAVDAIRARFEALKPYNPDIVKDDLLELEDENFDNGERRELWCYGISAKRYVLYNRPHDGAATLRGWSEVDTEPDLGDNQRSPAELLKSSEHGLGHLLNPTDPESTSRDWIGEAWQILLRADDALPTDGPEWLGRPAIARSNVSSPLLRDLFATMNDGKPYSEQIKPFNFMNTAFVPRGERSLEDQRMVLVAPYERDATRWLQTPWWNRYSGREYRLTLEPSHGRVRPGIVRPRSYRDVLAGYLTNEEAKSADSTGEPCRAGTRGLLNRRRVLIKTLTHIGKESNRLEDAQSGLIEDIDEIVNQYDDYYDRVFVPLAVPVLRDLGVRETHRRTGHSVGAVSKALARENPSRPEQAQIRTYVAVAVLYARGQLENIGTLPATDPIAVLRQYQLGGYPPRSASSK